MKIVTKIISITLISALLFQNILWANPETCASLQVSSKFMSYAGQIELSLAYVFKIFEDTDIESLNFPIVLTRDKRNKIVLSDDEKDSFEHIDLNLISDGIQINLDFRKKQKIKDKDRGTFYSVPCIIKKPGNQWQEYEAEIGETTREIENITRKGEISTNKFAKSVSPKDPHKEKLAQIEEVEKKTLELFGHACGREEEKKLEEFLIREGEWAIKEFVDLIEKDRGESIGSWWIPPYKGKLPKPGNISESDEIDKEGKKIKYGFSEDVKGDFEKERTKMMARIAIQRALGRKVVVVVGIGFVGTAEVLVSASRKAPMKKLSHGKKFRNPITGEGHPVYAIGYNRVGPHMFKEKMIDKGLVPVRTGDPTAESIAHQAHERGNMAGTFLPEVVATSDYTLLSIEQHPHKIMPGHPEMIFADPEPGLRVIREVAKLLPPEGMCVIESTVFPLYMNLFALPTFKKELGKRKDIPEGYEPMLAYSFQRLEPGKNWLESNRNQKRMGGAETPKAIETLKRYFDLIGYDNTTTQNITSPEYTKDCENATRLQTIGSLAMLQTLCELLGQGKDMYKLAELISKENPDDIHKAINLQPTLYPGGYCVTEQLGHLIYGLLATRSQSELDIMATYWPSLATIIALRHRAQDLAYWLVSEFTRKNIPPTNADVCVMGVAYNPQVNDTRNGQAELLVRSLADLGVLNITAIDPYVERWNEIQAQKRHSPECELACGLINQDWLKSVNFISDKDPYKALKPSQDAIVLATDHPQFIGKNQPPERRTDGQGKIWDGLDAVKVTAYMRTGEGKIIVDTRDFLSDEDIKEFLALGWQVRVFGKDIINKIRETIDENYSKNINHRLQIELEQLNIQEEPEISKKATHNESEILDDFFETKIKPSLQKLGTQYAQLASLSDVISSELDEGGASRIYNAKALFAHLKRLRYLMYLLNKALKDGGLVQSELLGKKEEDLHEGPETNFTDSDADFQNKIKDSFLSLMKSINGQFEEGLEAIGASWPVTAGIIASERPRTHGALSLKTGLYPDSQLLDAADALEEMLGLSQDLSALEARAISFSYRASIDKLKERPTRIAHTVLTELVALGLKTNECNICIVREENENNKGVEILKARLKDLGYNNVEVSDIEDIQSATEQNNVLILVDQIPDIRNSGLFKARKRKAEQKGRLIFDIGDALSDKDIKDLVDLDWRVAGVGKGHIYSREVLDIEGKKCKLPGLVDKVLEPETTKNQRKALDEAIKNVAKPLREDVSKLYQQVAQLSETLKGNLDNHKLTSPHNSRELLRLLRSFAYLNYAVDNAVVDTSRAMYDVLTAKAGDRIRDKLDEKARAERGDRLELPESKTPEELQEKLRYPNISQRVILKVRKILKEKNPDGNYTDEEIIKLSQEKFYQRFTAAGDLRVLPAIKIHRHKNNKKIEIEVDPDGNLEFYSMRLIPDVANGKGSIPEEFFKYTIQVPLYVMKVTSRKAKSDYFITEELLRSSLPWKTKQWLIKDVLGKGKIITTIKTEDAELTDKVAIVGHANPYTDIESESGIAGSGRAGFLVSLERGKPELVVTTDEYGREEVIEIKGIGPLLGSRTREEIEGMIRTITGGTIVDKKGQRKQMHVRTKQLYGLVRGGDLARILIELSDQPAHRQHGAPSGIAAGVFYTLSWDRDQPLTQVWRTGSGNHRGGSMPIAGDEDYNAEDLAHNIGWNYAEILAGMGSSAYVHIALGLDNMKLVFVDKEGKMHYVTDEESFVDLANERDPSAAFRSYFEWVFSFILSSFSQVKEAAKAVEDYAYFPYFLDGFLDHFLSQPIIKDNPQAIELFSKFYSYNLHCNGNDEYREIRNNLVNALDNTYVPYRALLTRLNNGYDPTAESPYTNNKGEEFTPKGKKAYSRANAFLKAEKRLLEMTQKAITEGGYPELSFDFEEAFEEITEKREKLQEIRTSELPIAEKDYSEIYGLSYYHGVLPFEHAKVNVGKTFPVGGSPRMVGILESAEVHDKRALLLFFSTGLTQKKTKKKKDKKKIKVPLSISETKDYKKIQKIFDSYESIKKAIDKGKMSEIIPGWDELWSGMKESVTGLSGARYKHADRVSTAEHTLIVLEDMEKSSLFNKLSPIEARRVRLAVLLHDIGKTNIPSTSHGEKSAQLTKRIFTYSLYKALGYKGDKIKDVIQVDLNLIKYHDVLAVEFLPEFLRTGVVPEKLIDTACNANFDKKFLEILTQLHISDVAEREISPDHASNLKKLSDALLEEAKTDQNPSYTAHPFLRNLIDAEDLSQNVIGAMISVALNEKRNVILAFDKNIEKENPQALQLVNELNRIIHKNNKFKNALEGEIDTFEGTPDELKKLAIDESNSLIFTFAPMSDKKDLENLCNMPNVKPVFMEKGKDFSVDHYYPIIEIVIITLAQHLLPDTINDIVNIFRKFGISPDELNIDITSIKKESNALIFRLIPNVERYAAGERVSKDAKLQRFLRSA